MTDNLHNPYEKKLWVTIRLKTSLMKNLNYKTMGDAINIV